MTTTQFNLGDVRVTLNTHTIAGIPVVHEQHVGKAFGQRNMWYVEALFAMDMSWRLRTRVRQCKAHTKGEMITAIAKLKPLLRQ